MKDSMTIELIICVFVIHWVADFIMQTDQMAKGKSTSVGWLIVHTLTYSVVTMIFYLCIYMVSIASENSQPNEVVLKNLLLFTIITFVAHTITDFFTSKWSSHLWKKGEVHNFFIVIGLDQVLHYAQLFITLFYLFK